MCLSEGRREREETILGGKAAFTKLLQRLKKTYFQETVTGIPTSQLSAPPTQPPTPAFFPLAASKQNSFFSSTLLYSWHGQFPFAKKIFRLIKEIRKSDE